MTSPNKQVSISLKKITIIKQKRCVEIILFALDCDGSIETSHGSIPVSLLYKLMSEGFLVYIVSPSPFCARLDIPHYAPLGARWRTLKRLKSMVKADRYIYVGDTLGDYEASRIAGFEFIYAKDFEKWIAIE